MPWILILLFLASLGATPVRAIENIPSSSFNLAAPTNSNISGWTSGWTQPAVQPTGYTYTTGWNYVGSVSGNSAVYLGNNWVLTAAHVGAGDFYLNGVTYPMLAGTAQQIGAADLELFQISSAPDLPALPLRSTAPVENVSLVAMIGWGAGGGNRNETWGYNTINVTDYSPLTPEGTSYVSTGFLTLTKSGNKNPENLYGTVVGDSGGADFIYNSSSSRWELVGINDVDGIVTYSDGTTGGFSGCVQLSSYYTSITNIVAQPLPTDTPAMPLPGLIVMAGALFLAASRYLGPTPAE
jgi:hypothetical protein